MYLNLIAQFLLELPRWIKRSIVLFLDILLCIIATWLAYYLRLGEFISFFDHSDWSLGLIKASLMSILIALPLFIVSGLYRAIFRYNGWPALLAVARSVSVYSLFYASIFTIASISGVPRTIGIIQPILLFLFVGGSRALARFIFGNQYHHILRRSSRPKVLIYGAGYSGQQLRAALSNNIEMQIIGFLDDDKTLHGQILNGKPIYNPADLPDLVRTLSLSSVLLAMPNLTRTRRNEILDHIRSAHIAVRTLPSVTDLAQGRVSISDIRELDIDDLLGREPVSPNENLLSQNIFEKVVLVTGAGGSIGSELCRQIITYKPRKLILIDHNEFGLYSIHHELTHLNNSTSEIIPLLASIKDSSPVEEIIKTYKPHTIYHAAAYKHVPLVENNIIEGIKNNVFGTLCVVQLAIKYNVAHFILVSTDKAVRPTNVMGATKRLAEMILQALSDQSSTTILSMVRFGNVLESSGSVVPKFRQQIRDGGPITLTHPDVTRYFMTIPEASQLVIQAGAMAKGGDVFVLDMGQSVKIIDLARRMIELSGLTVKDEQNPDGDIEIEIIGLRPGEKLYEELLIGDNPKPTSHTRIMNAHEEFLPWEELDVKLKSLEKGLRINDVGAVRLMLQQLVTGYAPSEEIVDCLHIEQESMAQALGLENF
jgi:FlaA1/EpsC-like NDP-sugar epimerase